MVACRVTFEFYNVSENGLFARMELSETVEVFGCRKSDVMTEDGKAVQERFELLLLVQMGLTPADVEEYDYHTVECTEHEIPDGFLEELDEDDEEDSEEETDEDTEEDSENDE